MEEKYKLSSVLRRLRHAREIYVGTVSFHFILFPFHAKEIAIQSRRERGRERSEGTAEIKRVSSFIDKRVKITKVSV